MRNLNRSQKGFTLVEIAIVLVIIGLLLGGVVKGRELITNAKIKSMAQDLHGITTAHYSYLDRTGTVSGDNDSNGRINDDSDFWVGLYTEGFVSGTVPEPTPPPPFDPFANNTPRIVDSVLAGTTHALNGVFYVGGDKNMFEGKNFVCAANVQANYAKGLDIKLDDGNATTGSIRTRVDIETPVKESDIQVIVNPGIDYGNSKALSHICLVMK